MLGRRAGLEAIEATVGIDEPDRAAAMYADAPMAPGGGVDFGDTNRILDDQIALGEQLIDRRQRIAELSGPAQVTPPEVATLDGVDGFTTALAAATAQLLAVEQIMDVEEQIDSTSGLLARIGSLWSDIDGDVDEARAELESGDTAAALEALDGARAQIDDLDVTGALRLAIAGAVLGLLVMVLVMVLVLVDRRRRSRRDERPQDVP